MACPNTVGVAAACATGTAAAVPASAVWAFDPTSGVAEASASAGPGRGDTTCTAAGAAPDGTEIVVEEVEEPLGVEPVLDDDPLPVVELPDDEITSRLWLVLEAEALATAVDVTGGALKETPLAERIPATTRLALGEPSPVTRSYPGVAK
jgi:hypothetical protein